jgi:hypothetical protein
VRQEPRSIYSYRNTLDIISDTHMAFLEFDISSLVSVHLWESSQIYLKLHVEWVESDHFVNKMDEGDGLEAHIVLAGKKFTNDELSFNEVKNAKVIYHLTRMRQRRSGTVYFDATEAILRYLKLPKSELSEFKNVLQLRLTTSKFVWTKFSSAEAADYDKRPVLIQGIVGKLSHTSWSK